MFTNREIAIIIWVNLFILYCLLKGNVRHALKNVIKAMFNNKLVFLYFIIYSYLGLILFVLYKINYWNINLLKDTIIWFITVPICSIIKAEDDSKKYFKETLKSCFEIYILVEFIGVNYPFSLWIELIIVPIIIIFSLVGECGEKLGGTKVTTNFSYLIVIIISVISFVHSIKLAILDIHNIFTIETFKNIAFIPILTLFYLPLTYFIIVFMNYETFYFRINLKQYLSKKEKMKILFKAIKDCKLSLNRIKSIKLEEYIDVYKR